MILMFAYGMNTNIGGMKIRCPRSKSIGAAVLSNFRFRFAYHADIVPCDGSIVHGVLWEITEQCLGNLDALEGYPHYYDRILVPVTCNGVTYESWVYCMQPGTSDRSPSNGYFNMVKEGYVQHSVPLNQIDLALSKCENLTENA